MVNDTGGETQDHQTAVARPSLLLTGLRRSGKTSIQHVIFSKMQPSQTQFLESTPQLTSNHFSCGSFINIQIQELPGQLHTFPSSQSSSISGGNSGQASPYDDDTNLVGGGYNMERLLKQCNAVVYIIDAQDDYNQSIARLHLIIQLGRRVNPKIRYEVFIHKVDQLSEEVKRETQRDIHNQIRDRFADSSGAIDPWLRTSFMSNSNSQEILINFHLTSIYDHSIFEAFSKVIQKLLPQFGQLEYLLNHLLSASNIERAFLFDIQTKISIATDSAPSDIQIYELCCDMIDLLINMSEIYGQPNINCIQDTECEDDDSNNEPVMNGNHSSTTNSCRNSSLGTTPITNNPYTSGIETTNEPASNVFDSMSSSIIKLTGHRALYLKEINHHLALICVLRDEALSKQAIIDYNVEQFKEYILKLFRLNQENSESSMSS
ncbi:unnamed protein product [Adineta steineri]|uniref:GTP-binding protein n=4 Tax=Adineta steineri TaxID=433720 RepID=A0A819DQA6_9BILA|nr:unnamed protein product [Adineta steineri]CAF1322885.1 unnamed protein product [Adineta steineri]CAF3705170.1 unnamed protein product [Adineta steineri]CAF3736081.1 unnamed protein product [Adineta steineri]CAF3839426.1 unnamed protein product [Adineta steineri]